MGERWYRMRAMVPDENRSKLDELKPDPDRLRGGIVAAGQIVGWAHVRGAQWAKTESGLAQFAAARELNDVLAAAARATRRARHDFDLFRQAYQDGKFKVHEP